MIYMATPEYFGVYARRFYKLGVAMVGGCCGTGPEHIRSIAGAARMMGGGRVTIEAAAPSVDVAETAAGVPTACPTQLKTGLSKKISEVYESRVKGSGPVAITPKNFVVSVEVNPPSGLDASGAIAAARMLREAGIDVVNIADGPRATVRMSNQTLAHLIQEQVGIEVLLHVCCRDRNLLGLQADLLADHVLGIDNLVIITGDPPKMGDYPQATAVFDLDSIGLLRLTNGLNRGFDPSGKPMQLATCFYCACGAEPAAQDYERELRRLEEKRAAGAELIMTQPVYDPQLLRRFLDDTKHLNMPVLIGLLPLASYRNAEFLHNEVPGMQIPGHIRERMREVSSGAAARAEGVKIAQEALAAVVDDVVGAYIMPPFGRYRAALEILEPFGYPLPPDTDDP
jgi:homocysteine S-methyltransferase